MGLRIVVVEDGVDRIRPGDHVLVKRTWPSFTDGDCVVISFDGKNIARKITNNQVLVKPDLPVPFEDTVLIGKILLSSIEF